MDHPAIAQDKAQTVAFLQTLFGFLCSDQAAGGMLGSNVWVLATAVRLIGDYAAWFGKAADAPLEGALKYLLRGLSTQQVTIQQALLPVCWQVLFFSVAKAPQPCTVGLLLCAAAAGLTAHSIHSQKAGLAQVSIRQTGHLVQCRQVDQLPRPSTTCASAAHSGCGVQPSSAACWTLPPGHLRAAWQVSHAGKLRSEKLCHCLTAFHSKGSL